MPDSKTVYEAKESIWSKLLDDPRFAPDEKTYAYFAARGVDRSWVDGNDIRRLPAGVGDHNESIWYDLLNRRIRGKWGDLIVIPHYAENDKVCHVMVRPEFPDGEAKWLSPSGCKTQPYIMPPCHEMLKSHDYARCYIVEGVPKAICLSQRSYNPVISVPGVWGGCKAGSKQLHDALMRYHWKGMQAVIVFDSDIARNPDVEAAAQKLKRAFQAAGAMVFIVRIPDDLLDHAIGCGNTLVKGPKLGVDDYAVKFGDAALRKLFDDLVEESAEKPLVYTAAPEQLAEDFLAARRHPIVDWNLLHGYDPARHYWAVIEDRELQSEAHRWLLTRYSNVSSRVSKELVDSAKLCNFAKGDRAAPFWLTDDPPPGFENLSRCIVTEQAIVHLDTGEATPLTEELFATYAVPVSYDLKAGQQPHRWLRHLRETLRDQHQIDILQEYMGYSLMSDTSKQKFLMLLGEPGCGKGTIMRVWSALLGGDRNVADTSMYTLDNQFGWAQTVGKPLIKVNDATSPSTGERGGHALEFIKCVTGEDPITINEKRIKIGSARITGKIVVIANELLKCHDTAFALGRRLIPLQAYPRPEGSEVIDGLSEKIFAAEGSAILNWMIEGYRRVMERGFTALPADGPGQELMDIQRQLSSPAKAWLEERAELGEGYSCLVDDVYSDWKHWCENNNHFPGSPQTFGSKLKAAAPDVYWAKGPRVKLSNGKEVQPGIYKGIKMLPVTGSHWVDQEKARAALRKEQPKEAKEK